MSEASRWRTLLKSWSVWYVRKVTLAAPAPLSARYRGKNLEARFHVETNRPLRRTGAREHTADASGERRVPLELTDELPVVIPGDRDHIAIPPP
jgi:hypothetical protein